MKNSKSFPLFVLSLVVMLSSIAFGQFTRYERGENDRKGKGEMPSFKGKAVAIRLPKDVAWHLQTVLSQMGVEYFSTTHPEMASQGRGQERQAPVQQQQMSAFPMVPTQQSQVSYSGNSGDPIDDPCAEATENRKAHFCISLVPPSNEDLGEANTNSNVWLRGRNWNLNSGESNQLRFSMVTVRIDWTDENGRFYEGGRRTVAVPAGTFSSWTTMNDRNVGSWYSTNGRIGSYVALTRAIEGALTQLLRKGNGWQPGFARIVARSGNYSPDDNDQ